jgi:phage gp36-like protein
VPVYATRQDIERSYGSQYLETLVAVDLDMDVAVEKSLTAASAEIDLYLGQRYSVPLSVVPAVIQSWAVDLACWKLAPNAAQNSAETAKRADRVFAMLKDIASGKSRIPELEPTPPAGGALAGIPSGEVNDAAQGGAVFVSDRRRYGQGGAL